MTTRHGLSWLLIALGVAAIVPACGGDDDGGGTGGKDGGGGGITGGSGGTGGSAGSGGSSGKAGSGGKGGTGGSKDAGPISVPCGDANCLSNSMRPLCDTAAGRCVECTTDANCPFTARPTCNRTTGTCVACITDANCPTATPYCVNNACRVCTTTMGCTPPQQCITQGNTTSCQLRCMSDGDCATAPNNNRACNLQTMMCVQCQNNTHCAGNATGPICVGTTCRQCGVDTDCAAPNPVCINNSCTACRDNTQCAQPTPACVRTGNTGTCRECATSTDCASKPGLPACVTNVCRQC
ncbi:MAG: hypothetical protein ABW133_02585, partial [Polyangiaceae bacterium]